MQRRALKKKKKEEKGAAKAKAKTAKAKAKDTTKSEVEAAGNKKVEAKRKTKNKNDKQEKKKDEAEEGNEEKKEKTKRKRSSSPACFARRKCPNTKWGKMKWQALKRVFKEDIRPKLTKYSSHEDTCKYSKGCNICKDSSQTNQGVQDKGHLTDKLLMF